MSLRCWAVHEAGLDPDGVGGFPLIELSEPTREELAELGRRLALGPEALEDASADHLRPQLRAHPGCLAVVVKTPTLDDSSEVELGEVVALVTAQGAALVGRAPGSVLADVRRLLAAGARQPAEVLLALVEVVTPDLDEVLVGLDEDVAEVEAQVFSADRVDHSRAIYSLKRELLELRRAVVPLAGVVERLAREPSCPVPDGLRDDFRGLLEHTARTADGVDHLDGLISSALDAQLAQIGVRQNEDQRKISAWAAIALVPTVVGAVYGMNFEHMPELSWRYGYPAALTLVVAVCLALYAGFRRSGWL